MIAIIPIRKGSFRIKNKNLRKIKGKTLVEITLNKAIKCKEFKKIIIYHDYEKFNFQLKYKKILFIKRPTSISKRRTSTEETLIYFFKRNPDLKKYVNFTLLQVTSPLRTINTIKKGIKIFKKLKNKSLVSVVKKNTLDKNYKKIIFSKNKNKYITNGVLYISSISKFLKTKKIYTKNSRTIILNLKESIDIDSISDLKKARKLI